MLQLARIGLAIIVILFAGYGLFTEDFVYQSYMMFSLGLLMLVMGVEEFRRDRRVQDGYVWLFFYLHPMFPFKDFL